MSLPSTPLADITNQEAPVSPAGVIFKAFSPDPIPPPAPVVETTPDTPTETTPAAAMPATTVLDALISHVPTLSSRSLKGLALGHAICMGFYLSGASPLSVASWLILLALIGNGAATTLGLVPPAAMLAPFSPAEVVSRFEPMLQTALELWGRVVRGDGKICFASAVTAWTLTIATSHVSAPTLAWLVFVMATGACSLKVHAAAVAPHASMLRERVTTFMATFEMPSQLSTNLASARALVIAPATRAYSPLFILIGWMFCLGWYHKGLTAGLGLLAYKAWATPEDVESFVSSMPKRETVDAVATKLKKGARRMTMSAADLMGMGTPRGKGKAE